MKTMKVKIADLFPYELAVVKDSYKEAIKSIESGKGIMPPRIFIFESGEMMVVDGNNRVKAAKDKGWLEVDVKMSVNPSKDSLRNWNNTLPLRKEGNLKGFSNLPIVKTEDERDKMTYAEMQMIGKMAK